MGKLSMDISNEEVLEAFRLNNREKIKNLIPENKFKF